MSSAQNRTTLAQEARNIGMRLSIVAVVCAVFFAWFQQEQPPPNFARVPARYNFEFSAADRDELVRKLQVETERQLDLIRSESLKPARGPFRLVAKEVSRKVVETREILQMAGAMAKTAGLPVFITTVVTNVVIPITMTYLGATGVLPLFITGGITAFASLPHELWVGQRVLKKRARELEKEIREEIGEEAFEKAKELKKRLQTPFGRNRVLSVVYTQVSEDEELLKRLEVQYNSWYRNWVTVNDDFGDAIDMRELQQIIKDHGEEGKVYLDSIYPSIARKREYVLMLLNYAFSHPETLDKVLERMHVKMPSDPGTDRWVKHHLDLFEDYVDELTYSQEEMAKVAKEIKKRHKDGVPAELLPADGESDEALREHQFFSSFEKGWTDDLMSMRSKELRFLQEAMARQEMMMLNAAAAGEEYPMDDFIKGIEEDIEKRRQILTEMQEIARDPLRKFDKLMKLEADMWASLPTKKSLVQKCSSLLKNFVSASPNFID